MSHRKTYTHEYYSLEPILSHPSSYYMIFGERGPGKSYQVKKRFFTKYKQEDSKFIYIRRFQRQKIKRRNKAWMKDVQDLAYSMFSSYVYYDYTDGFYIEKEDGTRQTIGYALSIEEYVDDKGGNYQDVNTVVFEEFVESKYLDDEVNRFLNLLSTIIRNRKDVEVFMLGNSVTKTCPYFSAFGIDIHKIKIGNIYQVTHQRGVTIAIEHTKSFVPRGETRANQTNKYFGFDNQSQVSMIMYGDWETKDYEIKSIDGKTWANNRTLLHFVYYGLGKVYECSYSSYKGNPVVFIRTINTQEHKLNEKIRYVISNTRTQFTNKNGYVPLYTSYSIFFPDDIKNELALFRDCIKCGRMVFTSREVGTDFMELYASIS